jgi:DNA-binding NtrC family response regulator
MILRGILSGAGHHVDVVDDLAGAMERREREFYHVVITDIGLDADNPENIDGIKLLEWVKQRYPDTKTLAISGRSVSGLDKEHFKEKYGALEYIERINFDPETLLTQVEQAIKLSKEHIQKAVC